MEFGALYEEVKLAIAQGVHPQRIPAGSSGSYFVLDRSGAKAAVFKPRSEEPYAQLNPKWTKWLQRLVLPCCFGRDPLIPNQGYLSEAGASVVDRWFGLSIVPETHVVRLGSQSFHYKRPRALLPAADAGFDEYDGDVVPPGGCCGALACGRPAKYPLKAGSMQRFVTGSISAFEFMKRFGDSQTGSLPRLTPEANKQFREQFERLVVLDYTIRNTDRGNDNWLVTFDDDRAVLQMATPAPAQVPDVAQGATSNGASTSSSPDSVAPSHSPEGEPPSPPLVRVWAIDNGLAFPYKHPNHWRTYPYAWAWLPQARVPFSQRTREFVTAALADDAEIENLVGALRELFCTWEGGSINNHLFRDQMRVLRGQLANLREAMADPASTPASLAAMTPCYVDARVTATGEGDSFAYTVWRTVNAATDRACFKSC